MATTVRPHERDGTVQDPLPGWDPRRRASLERLWKRFREAAGEVRSTAASPPVPADRRLSAKTDLWLAEVDGSELAAA